ncbi:Metacaspase-1 [Russula emetica]|nr:Metacaspase-1 [Russula emetica]
MPGSSYTPAMPHSGPSLNFQGVRNFNVPDQAPSRSGYPRSHYYDNLLDGTTHTPYGPGVDHEGYDTPHTSQQPPMGSRSPTEFVQIYSVQSADSPYPLGFGSARAWDPWAGSYSLQSTSESHSHYIPGGFIFQQGMRCTTAVSLSQRPAGIHSAWGGPYSTSLVTKRRKALVIGTNHPLDSDPRYRLECCTRDAYSVADFLHYKLGFARNDIRVITDDNPDDLPTKENIIEAMKTLVRGAQAGDSFFFYFSGHGIQIKDRDGDESDGLDECICAMDYRGDDPDPDCNTPGLIVDDTMHDLMVKPLPPQCRLTAVYDCCHSGTILDLPVIYNSSGAAKPFIHIDGPWVWSQKISSADVVSLSASKDNQEAAESRQGGALQRAFIDSVSRFGNTLTYKGLIRNMRDYMRRRGFKQKPQLSTSHKIDTNLPFVV